MLNYDPLADSSPIQGTSGFTIVSDSLIISAPGGTTYADLVRSIAPANLIQYLPMNETSGTTANDLSGGGRNGGYSGVTLAVDTFKGMPVASWDGTNDFVTTYSASLNSAFNNAEGTAVLWCRVSGAGVWTDGAARVPFYVGTDASNRVGCQKTAAADTILFLYNAGGTLESANIVIGPTTDWFHIAISWSKAADEVKFYVNGVQSGSTLTTLGTWSGALVTDFCRVGSLSTSSIWSGNLAHWALWTTPLTPAQIATLAA